MTCAKNLWTATARASAGALPALRVFSELLCERAGVLAIDRKRDSATIKFTEQAQIEPERLARFVAQSKGAQFSPGGSAQVQSKVNPAG